MRVLPRLPLTLAALLTVAAGAPGCGLLGGLLGGGAATEGGAGHVVFLTRPACATLVARTEGGPADGFSLLAVREAGYTPQQGDLLEGPAREGRSVFTFYPPDETATRSGGRSVDVEVLALRLAPGEARARLDAACGPPVEPPPDPR